MKNFIIYFCVIIFAELKKEVSKKALTNWRIRQGFV